jgi:hypothetical protein
MALCGWIFEQSDDAHGRGRSGERRVWDGFGLLVGIPVGLIGVIALLRYDFVGLF